MKNRGVRHHALNSKDIDKSSSCWIFFASQDLGLLGRYVHGLEVD